MNTMKSDDARIVVVDDVADTAEVLAMILETAGYEVRTALSGEAALELVAEFQPLCVLMDINMPGLGGHELCQCLRDRYGDDLVLIAVTGAGHVDDRVGASFARFDHYLRKPVDIKLLRQLLPPLH